MSELYQLPWEATDERSPAPGCGLGAGGGQLPSLHRSLLKGWVEWQHHFIRLGQPGSRCEVSRCVPNITGDRAAHSGLSHGGGGVGLEALVSPLVREQS